MESEAEYRGSPRHNDSQHHQRAEQKSLPRIWYQYYATFTLCVASFATGASQGWASPMIQILGSDDSPVGKMTNMEISPLETLPSVAAIVGVIAFAGILTKFGRKVTGYLGAVFGITGGLFLLLATVKLELYIGRFMMGLSSVGLGMVGPIYLSEIAYPSIRGALMTYTQFASQTGSLVSFLLGIVCGYRWFTAFSMVGIILFPMVFFLIPESPHYLLLQSKNSEAHDALLWYRGDSNVVDQELNNISKITPKKVNYRVIFQNRVNRKMMIIFCFLYVFNIMSGSTVIMGYASKIFQESDSSLEPNVAAAILATIKFFSSLASIFVIDRTGRRFLVIFSFTIMGASLVVTTVYFYLLQMGSSVNNQGWIPIASLSTFIAANTMGVGTVGTVIATEMLTPEIKAVALGILGILATGVTFLSLQLYSIFVEYIGSYFNFLVEAAFSISSIFIAWYIVPETKGKSITEIVEQLSKDEPRLINKSQETLPEHSFGSISTISAR
uniref:Facilitated trehalose transporter Tret1 n=1 Tax=Lygus hesperus TaxID=30085 RepID=A0A146LHT7_LYGHE